MEKVPLLHSIYLALHLFLRNNFPGTLDNFSISKSDGFLEKQEGLCNSNLVDVIDSDSTLISMTILLSPLDNTHHISKNRL